MMTPESPETLRVLHMTMMRAGRERLRLDIRTGYPVSEPIVESRAEQELAIACRVVPRIAAVVGRHYASLRTTFIRAYRGELEAIVRGQASP